MKNGHMPNHMAWVSYRHQLWPGLRCGLGTVSNNIEVAENLFTEEDYKMHKILGIARTVSKGLRKVQQTFGGFGLISRINMLM